MRTRIGHAILTAMLLVPRPVVATEAQAANPALIADTAAMGTTGAVAAISPKDLIGRNITNPDDETVGEIDAVEVDAKGNVPLVIVAVGAHKVALDWKDLVISDGGRKISVDSSRDKLAAMPVYLYARPSQEGTVFPAAD